MSLNSGVSGGLKNPYPYDLKERLRSEKDIFINHGNIQGVWVGGVWNLILGIWELKEIHERLYMSMNAIGDLPKL